MLWIIIIIHQCYDSMAQQLLIKLMQQNIPYIHLMKPCLPLKANATGMKTKYLLRKSKPKFDKYRMADFESKSQTFAETRTSILIPILLP